MYVSPLCRAVDTARVLFPAARLVPVHDLREMCFGIFEGRNYVEMERDPDYLAWVGDDCMGRCPGGESRAEFSDRTCAAFASLVDEALARGAEMLFSESGMSRVPWYRLSTLYSVCPWRKR